MCIAVISTAHPDYAFLVISNRDEFLNRPTLAAGWWDEENVQILGGRDLQRAARGTWLGITKQGRVAILTNFREEGQLITSKRSRGEIPNTFLMTDPSSNETVEDFAKRLLEDDGFDGVGGFSLIFGQLKKQKHGKLDPLGIVSNRTPDVHGVIWIAQGVGETVGQTCALSNSRFGEHLWPKVVEGEKLLNETIEISSNEGETADQLLDRCFEILSFDTLPRPAPGESWETATKGLRHSIFIPPIGGSAAQEKPSKPNTGFEDPGTANSTEGLYGTQKQTVILVDHGGHVIFVEKSLFGDGGIPVPEADQIKRFKFQIEGWNS